MDGKTKSKNKGGGRETAAGGMAAARPSSRNLRLVWVIKPGAVH